MSRSELQYLTSGARTVACVTLTVTCVSLTRNDGERYAALVLRIPFNVSRNFKRNLLTRSDGARAAV